MQIMRASSPSFQIDESIALRTLINVNHDVVVLWNLQFLELDVRLLDACVSAKSFFVVGHGSTHAQNALVLLNRVLVAIFVVMQKAGSTLDSDRLFPAVVVEVQIRRLGALDVSFDIRVDAEVREDDSVTSS